MLGLLGRLGHIHEGVVLRGRGLLGGLGLRLEPGEVALDDLEHADDTARAALHALVGGHLRHLLLLLEERSLLAGVELLEDDDGLAHGVDARGGVRDGGRVLGLLGLALRRGLLDGLREVALLGHELGDGGALLVDGRGLAVDRGAQLADLSSLLVSLELVVLQLLVAPRLVVGLRGRLFLELVEETLDHADDLGEGVRQGVRGSVRQGLRVQGDGGLV
mmetsp:Transcript_18824/g.65617  ORF Transcript_18824/g.65617 Transcript_18824/m.65617 type:complete len:219 (+) Transcript_18824:320-976(+)